MGTEFLKIKEVKEANDIMKKLFNKLYSPKSEEVAIENSYKKVLFQDVKSSINLPPFNRSLKDGFALKSKDTFEATEENPKMLKCIDTVEAGSFSNKTVKQGECIEISTGATIPDGADAIAMVEFCEKENDEVLILKSVPPKQDIAVKGSDIEKNKLLLKKRTILSPDKIGVLSAQGIEKIAIFKSPKISVISTGNELLKENDEMKYGKIYDVNTNAIKNAIISCGGNGVAKGIVKDSYGEVKSAIQQSLKTSDIVICSGGTSAGVGDVLRHVLDDIGEVIIHGISVKPGKPTIIGKIDEKLIVGLPGNPVSALIIFYVFIAPNIRRLAGLNEIEKSKIVTATLSKRLHSSKGRMQYSLVKLEDHLAIPIIKDSGAITSLADADGYVKIPKSVELIDKGEKVKVNLFNDY
ncbi:MAG: molybdopterin molybdenumtransferase MoeA [Methanobacteriaceae archaeon]|jgi:molybdopterin molybdotransferase|nr:molybdopterin molybdenumtransferase MoeA [Candidatus Methanorudis spinitermitis]